MNYVILKVDTTGLDPTSADIIRISALRVDGEKQVKFSALVNPGRPIPSEASEISGVTDEDVKDAPSFEEVKESFLVFIDHLPIMGHNIEFDLKFINKYLDQPLENRCMSLMSLARAANHLGSLKFKALCKSYNITEPDTLLATDLLFHRLLEDFQKRKR